ncbi:hypothetical protein B9T62_02760 [Paenibacillus donghaensis]|uniref:Uncharacterized protein n=1 Tax=Paenibacillus donghaensis TaxID=414771 RepID=A0A2Z2KCX2_9BACL|nr:hypothetical protein B9T62_02760 [Paenibacillus donghaensis]
MTYKEAYDLHVQLLHVYEQNLENSHPYRTQINHFKKQFYIAEDMVQRIFVLNQIIKIHEARKEQLIHVCSRSRLLII